ncbi:MAG TPA: shikimate kinase [Chitinophagales bacterium]|nr:shikimate kinase [Chitinophagales bacterium]
MQGHAVFLVGFMGAGKTTFGKKLSNLLGYTFTDLDAQTCAACKFETVKALVEERGIAFFREAERDTLRNLNLDRVVVATGGGAPCFFDNMAWMKQNGTVVYLSVNEGVLYSRLSTTNLEERPLLKGLNETGLKNYIHQTLQERLPFYGQAHIVFSPVDGKPETLVQQLKAAWASL